MIQHTQTRACQPTPQPQRSRGGDATPVWLMRQAGRYMAEYRALRQRHTILELIKAPELACEVTMQPINAFDLDAAIIFADILPPLEGMGLSLEFVKGEGPLIHNPVRSRADVDALAVRPAEETLPSRWRRSSWRARSWSIARRAAHRLQRCALHAGGLCRRGGRQQESRARQELDDVRPGDVAPAHGEAQQVVGGYLLAQAQAGAQVLQLFDSWVGQLSPDDYRAHVLPWSRRAIEIARAGGVPIIHFGTDTAGLLPLIREAGGDVIGVDWRIDLDAAWHMLGDGVAVQGNLDPIALFAPWEELRPRIQQVLDRAHAVGRPGHIFNLGHGILPQTPVENVKRLVEYVHEYSQGLRE